MNDKSKKQRSQLDPGSIQLWNGSVRAACRQVERKKTRDNALTVFFVWALWKSVKQEKRERWNFEIVVAVA